MRPEDRTNMAGEKRKADDIFDERAWKIMQGMGYKSGQGLGTHSQGIVEPVDVSKQKGRRGLGLMPKSSTHAQPSEQLYKSTDAHLVWEQGVESTVIDDNIWCWIPSKAYSSSTPLHFSPDDAECIGTPIREMDDQNKFCSSHLLKELLNYKNQLDNMSEVAVTESHQRCNPYEQIKKGIFMNRAAMKLANLDARLDGLLTNSAKPDEILYFADICAGPGGFSEYILWRRCNVPLLGLSSSANSSDEKISSEGSCVPDHSLDGIPRLAAKGFGLTLKGKCDFRLNDFLAGPSEAFFAHYGPRKDGDITRWVNLASFSACIARSTEGKGVHIVVGDGGFDVSGQQNLQEVLSKRIYLCQCLCALMVLRRGGHFITKLFDVFTEFSVGLIYLVGQFFRNVAIIKPVTSRPANSERYLVCKSLISPLTDMAGCPSVPKTDSKAGDCTGSHSDRGHRFSARKVPSYRQPQEDTFEDGDSDLGVLDLAVAGELGELINYLIQVNEKIDSFQSGALLSRHTAMDIIRLCPTATLQQDKAFYKFITTMNDEFATQQCLALSKLLTFAHDRNLVESHQLEMKVACMKRWKIRMIERESVPWPLMSGNHSAVIHELLGDRGKSLNMLPVEYRSHLQQHWCRNSHLSDINNLINTRIVLVCGTSSKTDNTMAKQPMFVYSRGQRYEDQLLTVDGVQWHPVRQVMQCIRLPPGTLVLGQPTCEYVSKSGLRRQSFTIFDVVCIYGYDCRQLSYRQRMDVAQRMCDVVNFPDCLTWVRIPPTMSIRELPNYVQKLPLLYCKDASRKVPMHRNPYGMLFCPSFILLVEHLHKNWIETMNRSTEQAIYFNHKTAELNSHIPPDQFLSFTQTRFIKVPWNGDHAAEVNISEFIETVNRFSDVTDECY